MYVGYLPDIQIEYLQQVFFVFNLNYFRGVIYLHTASAIGAVYLINYNILMAAYYTRALTNDYIICIPIYTLSGRVMYVQNMSFTLLFFF